MLLDDISYIQDKKEETHSLFLGMMTVCEDLHTALAQKIKGASHVSRTGKLWTQYLEQIDLVHLFIGVEGSGDWQMHLYCVKEMLPHLHAAGHFHYDKYAHLYVQKMEELDSKIPPEELHEYTEWGLFTIQRSHNVWSGVWTGMAIEQDLMRPMKVRGGLTHRTGISDSALAHFILSYPDCIKLCCAIEMLTGVSCCTSEQHLDNHSPWSEYDCLHSIDSGVVRDGNINCDSSVSVGTQGMKTMIGSSFGNVKLSRTNRVNHLASMSRSVIIRDEIVPVCPQQLFMRFAWAIHHQGGDLMVYI
ncbi:hypothetical protein PR048_010453 [Dryococelus australis]|uniref:Uncharacterized protein n=1 Tax=Dryococelus australis TaxID=614101 RepID=A0ABQ9I2R0_9NEOP|nr:hypothetical protein PR048_010453 [Dryococelus australis]